MLTKPLIFLLVFFLSIANLIFLFIPIILVFLPLFIAFKAFIIQTGPSLLLFIISRLSSVIVIYIIIDTLFGITMRRMCKNYIIFDKATSIVGHNDIMQSFIWLKNKFKIKKVKLYLNPDINEVNAYAIGSFSGGIITITMGLINQIHQKSSNHSEFIGAIQGILGHEMSHLVNKDFLPGLLANANKSANRSIAKIISIIFNMITKILYIIPWIGRPISNLLIHVYNLVNFCIMSFFKLFFMPLYNFIMNFLGRTIEYRCDRDSARAYGGKKMAKALEMLAAKGYFSIFSTHPTTKSRIKKVQNILPINAVIKPKFTDNLANYLSILLIISVCVFSTSITNLPNIYHNFVTEVYNPVKSQYDSSHAKFMKFYYEYKHLWQ